MAASGAWGRHPRLPSKRYQRIATRKLVVRFLLIVAFLAVVPPLLFHFWLRRAAEVKSRKCGWLESVPLVCAHGGDSSRAFPNTMEAYRIALLSNVDCVEIDVSRTSDGALVALHDRELQLLSGNSTTKVGHLSMNEIQQLRSGIKFPKNNQDIWVPSVTEALKLVSKSVRQVILDAKVGPPLYEKGLAADILSTINKAGCNNCLIWSKSDTLVRDVMRLSQDVPVGYIVMRDPSTGVRTNLLRMKGSQVVGVYHPLIDEALVRTLHRLLPPESTGKYMPGR
ncbi:glycerophosphodiester phosphodiesterase GDPD4 isoform X2 [Nymphaea colorata]|uniref:glycerophosphodiester phosphodiesterase GDPD4 isoform X2 n=1 Tax=Nymphaea colorata TaxID=210225 RepID=UPI00129DC37C|nr:glycerophosphodiester phosphodiesterase GDPD4 isoform X2 [Nymphaea colorata]